MKNNMKACALIIFIILSIAGCKHVEDSNKIKNIVPDSLFRSFIDYIKQDSLIHEIYKSTQLIDFDINTTFPDTMDLLKLNNYLDIQDVMYVLKQKEYSKHFRFDSTYFADKIIIPMDSIIFYSHKPKETGGYWNWIATKYKRINFCVIGFPYFNKKHDLVLINVSIHTSGMSGEGRSLLLKRIGDKWIVIKILDSFII